MGLSPRVRGNPDVVVPVLEVARSIPACTGKPCLSPARSHQAEVYPRVYGETVLPHTRMPEHTGLSPRVRGNLVLPDRGAVHKGSIPACTGKPGFPFRGHGYPAVYPRVYGETIDCLDTRLLNEGLSPRVRGNHRGLASNVFWERSIPACTGKPVSSGSRKAVDKVYPRVYGETIAVQGTINTY